MLTYDKDYINTLTGAQLNDVGQELLNKRYGDVLTAKSTTVAVSKDNQQAVFCIELHNGTLKAEAAFSLPQINLLISKGIIKEL